MPYAEAEGCRIHYSDEGRGTALLLIPGLGGSTRQLAAISNILSVHLRVLTVDPRGAGASDKPDIPYEGAMLSDDMAAVLTAADVESADVVGISFGGMIAQELAIRHPERVRSLILASSYAASDAWANRMWSVRETIIRGLGMAEHFQLAIMFLFSPATFQRQADTVAMLERAFAETPPDLHGYLRQLDYCRRHDTTDRLRKVAARTLVVTGAEDILTSPERGRALAAAIPEAVYREVPGVAHLFMVSDPLLFASMIREFIAEPRAPTTTRAPTKNR